MNRSHVAVAVVSFIASLGAQFVMTPGVALAVAPAGVAEVVRARRFEVVDAAGKVRAVLSLLPDGAPALWLNDAAGKRDLAMLYVTSEGRSGLRFDDAARKLRASMSLDVDGSPSMELRDESGKVMWRAP